MARWEQSEIDLDGNEGEDPGQAYLPVLYATKRLGSEN
jgi:hypothetical protein